MTAISGYDNMPAFAAELGAHYTCGLVNYIKFMNSHKSDGDRSRAAAFYAVRDAKMFNNLSKDYIVEVLDLMKAGGASFDFGKALEVSLTIALELKLKSIMFDVFGKSIN